MTTLTRILLIDDDKVDRTMVLRALEKSGLEHDLVEAPDGATGLRCAKEQAFDCVLLDYRLPDVDAIELLTVLLSPEGGGQAVVMLTGEADQEIAVRLVRAGALDYLTKAEVTPSSLARAIRYAKARREFLAELNAARREAGEKSRALDIITARMREQAERQAIEEQLRQAQKVESLGQLTGGVSHDFNNLLGVIVGNLDMLIETLRADPIQVELADGALNAALRGAELTSRLLAVARQQPLSTQVIDLNELLPGMVSILQRTLGEGIHINTSLAVDLWRARADPSRVEDALLNLAINARDAMPNTGALTIETANVQLDESHPAVPIEVTPGDYVMLSVTDTGVGMPPEVIARATEPFYTTKPAGKGTGLGLSMIYGFAKQSDGHLSIYSEVGLGTTVRLYLPKAGTEDADNVGKAAASGGDDLVRGGESILVVDDNSELLRVSVRRLTGLGYKCHEAENGPTALAILDSGERFDLLFTDIGLPGGISGYALAKLAEQRQPSLKVLFTTGYAKVQNRDGNDQHRSTHMLRKPYRSDELAEKVRAILDSTA